jgi:elongation factor Ts
MKKFLAEDHAGQPAIRGEPRPDRRPPPRKRPGVEITGFVRLEVGEGIEVEKEDFAAEVAKAAKG